MKSKKIRTPLIHSDSLILDEMIQILPRFEGEGSSLKKYLEQKRKIIDTIHNTKIYEVRPEMDFVLRASVV